MDEHFKRELWDLAGLNCLERLGGGGMGQVYKIYDPGLERFAAMKVLTANEDAVMVARFLREMRFLASLKHPNIVIVFYRTMICGRWVMVMELADGGTLAKRLQQARLTPEETIQLARQILSALAYLHARTII